MKSMSPFDAGRMAFAQGDFQRALAFATSALRLEPDHEAALVLVANAATQLGDPANALRALERLLELRPGQPQYRRVTSQTLNRLGCQHRQQQRDIEAQQAFARALETWPDNAEALYNQAVLLTERGADPAAAPLWLRAHQLQPADRDIAIECACALGRVGRIDEAAQVLDTMAPAAADAAPTLRMLRLAEAFAGADRPTQASALLARFEPEPAQARRLIALGERMAASGAIEEARRACALAARVLDDGRVAPGVRARIIGALVLPSVYEDGEDLRAHRDRYANALAELDHMLAPEQVAACERRLEQLVWSNFYLAYQGEDDRELQSRYGTWLARIAPTFAADVATGTEQPARDDDDRETFADDPSEAKAPLSAGSPTNTETRPTAHAMANAAADARDGTVASGAMPPQPRPRGEAAVPTTIDTYTAAHSRPDAASPARIAIVASIFRHCTAGSYFGSWIRLLAQLGHEVHVYQLGPLFDDFTEACTAPAARLHRVETGLNELAAELHAARFDLILYPEIGMDQRLLPLAALRLARRQACAWGHPVTTGLPTMDAYFTCAEMEPEDAATHYSETLLPLPGLGTDYARPDAPPPASRRALELPEDRRLYLLPHALFKLHPDSDAVFAQVAAADPAGVLVFFRGQGGGAFAPYRRRIARALRVAGADPDRQLLFLPMMPRERFLQVNRACDVMVDSLHWSGGNTALDALVCGLPVITHPGRFMRGRQSSAMLRRMGLGELVVDSPGQMPALAVRIASDPSLRSALSGRIEAGLPALFDTTGLAEALDAHLRALLRG